MDRNHTGWLSAGTLPLRAASALLALALALTTGAPAPANADNKSKKKRADKLLFGKPIRYHNITVVPVASRASGPHKRYTLLEDGIRKQTLTVREIAGNSGQARVSEVEVRNSGQRPVYLLGGEMILGGKQDRIIQNDTVVGATGKWTRVRVFCVERGRWRGQKMSFRAGGALAHAKLRIQALKNSQSAVWKEVARKNVEQRSKSSTDTYRRTIQNAKVRKRISRYVAQLLRKLPRKANGAPLAGLVFAINGQVRVADIFGNPLLFGALRRKLLSSYVLEAMGKRVVKNAPAVSAPKAATWLSNARRKLKRHRKQKKGKSFSSGRARSYNFDASDLAGSTSVDKASGKKVRETYMMH